MENKNLQLRTRLKLLARKTTCFSESEIRHDSVIGLLLNRYCLQLYLRRAQVMPLTQCPQLGGQIP
ncbi:MAG: IS1 family transposase [Gammaproteobacteria bacterium]